MKTKLWDKFFLKMRVLIYLQFGLAIYSAFAVYSTWKNNLSLGLLLSVSIVAAVVSIVLAIKGAADSWQLEQEMKNLNKFSPAGK